MHISSAPGGKRKKNLDFELNLVPFIDLLSVCIIFLLMTAVKFEVGSIDVKQAVGGQPQSETTKVPAVWAKILEDGQIELQLQDTSAASTKKLGNMKVPVYNGKFDYSQLKLMLSNIKNEIPELKTALVLPSAETKYEDVIDLMDQMKMGGITSLGVSPL